MATRSQRPTETSHLVVAPHSLGHARLGSTTSSNDFNPTSGIPIRKASSQSLNSVSSKRESQKFTKPLATYAQPTSASQRKSRHSMVNTTNQFINPKSRKSILYLHNSTSTSALPSGSNTSAISSKSPARAPHHQSQHPSNARRSTGPSPPIPAPMPPPTRGLTSRRSMSPMVKKDTSIPPPVPSMPEQLFIGRHRQIPKRMSMINNDLDVTDFSSPGLTTQSHRAVSTNAMTNATLRKTSRQVSGVSGPRRPPPSIMSLDTEAHLSSQPIVPKHGSSSLPRSSTFGDLQKPRERSAYTLERPGSTISINIPSASASASASASPIKMQSPSMHGPERAGDSSSPFRPMHLHQKVHPLPAIDTSMPPRGSPLNSLPSPASAKSNFKSETRMRSLSNSTKPWIPTSSGSGSALANVTTMNSPNSPSYANRSSPGGPPVAAATQRMISRNSHSTTNLRSFSTNHSSSYTPPSKGLLESPRKVSSSSSKNASFPASELSSSGLSTESGTDFPHLVPLVEEEELTKVREILKKMVTSRTSENSMTKQFKAMKLGSSHSSQVPNPKDEQPTINEPMTPAVATKACRLNMYEKGEILDYRRVYFCGRSDIKKINGDIRRATTNNYGFDDDKGNYHAIPGDHIAYRYRIVSKLGMGSFGKVLRCIDHKTGKFVAVKLIINRKRFHMQALVEADLLKTLASWNKHQYGGALPILNYVDHFTFRDHLCITTELLGINIYELLKYNKYKGFPIPLVRRFSRQILEALAFLEKKKIIHCDLKPENVLISDLERGTIKLIDFGSSCYENEKVYTYIQSRFYRSPEVMMGMVYDTKIDMWSFGCLVPEMVNAKALFPGNNELEQVAFIMQLFGPPDRFFVENCSRRKLYFDALGDPLSQVTQIAQPSSRSLVKDVLKGKGDPSLVDFIRRLLHWDPRRRLSAAAALQHEFLHGRPAEE